MEYPWYEKLNNSLQILQGYFVKDCPIIIPPATFEDEKELSVKLCDVFVMSQSCDIKNNKVDIILVCPYFNLEDFLSKHPTSQGGSKGVRNKVIDNLTQGNYPSYHILQKNTAFQIEDFLVFDF